MSGDKVAGIIGVLMALAIVTNGGTYRNMPVRKRALFGVIWAIIIGVVAVLAARLST